MTLIAMLCVLFPRYNVSFYHQEYWVFNSQKTSCIPQCDRDIYVALEASNLESPVSTSEKWTVLQVGLCGLDYTNWCVNDDWWFSYARLQNGQIMPWRCPPIRPSEVSRLFATCSEISIWNLIYTFGRCHVMSGLWFITIGHLDLLCS